MGLGFGLVLCALGTIQEIFDMSAVEPAATPPPASSIAFVGGVGIFFSFPSPRICGLVSIFVFFALGNLSPESLEFGLLRIDKKGYYFGFLVFKHALLLLFDWHEVAGFGCFCFFHCFQIHV